MRQNNIFCFYVVSGVVRHAVSMTSNFTESRSKGLSYRKYKEERLTDCYFLRRNCILKHVIEGKIEQEVTGIQGRRRNQVLDKFKGKRKYSKLKEEEPDRTVWRTRFVRIYGPVVR
jgi:hypothetical protein